MTLRSHSFSRAGHVVAAAVVTALAACGGRGGAAAPRPAASAASAAAASAARDSQSAADTKRAQLAYVQRVEWSYTGGQCAVTDPRGGLTRPFQCGRIRVGTQPEANVTDLVRLVRGRTVDLHPGEAPWRMIVVPTESERAALLTLLADERVRWAGVDYDPPTRRPARPQRRARTPAKARS